MTTYTLFRLSDRQAQKELATQRRYIFSHALLSMSSTAPACSLPSM